jgi:hypothetical protein
VSEGLEQHGLTPGLALVGDEARGAMARVPGQLDPWHRHHRLGCNKVEKISDSSKPYVLNEKKGRRS